MMEEAKMNKRWTFTALGFLFAALFVAGPARGNDVDQRIQALEEELTRLKSEQAQVKAEQIEMRKEATAAAAALPSFSYRTGNGMMIEAADKAWGLRATIEAHMRLLFESGLTEAGRETGGIMGRRLRPFFYYCVNDCLYEAVVGLDLDGFGTGNAKNSTNTGGSSILQRGTLNFHAEKLNPFLPTFYAGMDAEGAISSLRQGSSSTGSQMEYDLLSRNNGFNTGRSGNGIGINWSDISLGFLPGRIRELSAVYGTIGEGDDGLQSFREQRSASGFISIEPFSEIKNKWISGLTLEMGAWICPNKPNATEQNPQDIACSELRIRDNGDGGRQTLFRATVDGSGMTHFLMPGFGWTIGPYRFRAVGGWQRYDDDNSNVKGRVWLLGHDLFIWSPKGFLTGSATEPGSILLGTHFERTDVSCPLTSCNNGTNPAGFGRPTTGPASQQFHRNRIIVREADIWYFIQNRMSVGASFLWYDVSNIRQASALTGGSGIQSANNVARNLGCNSSHQATLKRPGKGCDWVDLAITWRYSF
jgi:hypothetical protein